MISKVFNVQWSQPVKNDLTVTMQKDLKDFKIEENLSIIKSKSMNSFRNLVRSRSKEFEFNRLMIAKMSHSKLKELMYTKLEMQDYLKLNNFDKVAAQTLFRYRVRMVSFGENFRGKLGPALCPLCGVHLDSQKLAVDNCKVIRENIKIEGSYSSIFSRNIPSDIANTLQEIDQFRELSV